jgi:hypothetical protein
MAGHAFEAGEHAFAMDIDDLPSSPPAAAGPAATSPPVAGVAALSIEADDAAEDPLSASSFEESIRRGTQAGAMLDALVDELAGSMPAGFSRPLASYLCHGETGLAFDCLATAIETGHLEVTCAQLERARAIAHLLGAAAPELPVSMR